MQTWIIFPIKVALGLGVLLIFNLYAARIPSLYLHYSDMEASGETWSYSNAMLIVLVSILPISLYALFWSVCNMLFHTEFTICPEK
jgi:hypothetical protein